MSTDRILQRGLLMVFASTVMFGLMGAIVGGLIGVFLPDYYYAMIPSIRNGGGSTWQLGIGLGLTQGAIGGALIGVILVVSTAFYKSRMRNSVAAMVAQMQALQSTSPQVDVVDEVDLASLTKTKSSAKTE